jgi:hypothetical protein
MASLNDKDAWRGDIDDVIAMSIRDSGMPLVDLTHDREEARPSGTVKDEPVDKDIDPRGKQDVSTTACRIFTSTTIALAAVSSTSLVLGLNFIEFHSTPATRKR